MYLACSLWHLIRRQINVVSGSGRHASCGGELIGSRTDRRVLEWHGWLQRLGRVMLRRFVHHLCPDWQCQSSAVAVWNNRCRLIEPDPDTARQRARVTYEPGVLVIIGSAGLPCRRQFESK